MAQAVTASGAHIVRHAAQFCRTADELIRGIEAFVRDGMNSGQAALVASAGATLTELRSRLDTGGEQISWIDLAGGGGRPGRFTSALLAFAERHRGQSVRCVQEPGWHTRPASELSEALRHEALVNLALTRSSASVLCAFSSELAEELRDRVRRTHPAVIRDGQWQSSRHFSAADTPWRGGEPLAPAPDLAARLTYRDDLRAVRRFAASRALDLGLPHARITDMVLAVSELVANTRGHTSGTGHLTIWAEPGEVICQVDDGGHITDPLAGIRRSPPGTPAGRQGIWVVYQLADLTEIRTSPAGTTVRLHMRTQP